MRENNMKLNCVYNMDAIDFCDMLDSDSVDAYVTDPPYCSGGFSEVGKKQAKGQGVRSEALRNTGWFINDNMTTSGLVFLLRAVAQEMYRTLKPGGSAMMFTDWRMLTHLAPAIESVGFRYQNMIVWDKGSMGLGTGFRPQHEIIMHFVKGTGQFHSHFVGNVISSSRVNASKRLHQTEKPVAILQKVIEVVSAKGGLIVDPFCGSGSTLEAAHNLDRNYLGSEINPEYVAIANSRLNAPRASAMF
jgi:DNA modification methylase